jgi:hypothetical protein
VADFWELLLQQHLSTAHLCVICRFPALLMYDSKARRTKQQGGSKDGADDDAGRLASTVAATRVRL